MKFDLILRWETGGRAVMAVAHLGHAEIRVTDLERSRWFFTEILGLYVTEENDERVYLRAWQDWDHHTLVLKKSDHAGVEHFGWRVEKPEDLGTYEKRLKEIGIDYRWIEDGEESGQGDGLRFLTPGGFPYELYWERELFVPKEGGPEGDGIEIEWGPGQHGTSGAIFLYFFEPSGNRVELWTGGFLIFAPDWEPIRWTPQVAQLGYELWGSDMPESYLTYGTESHFSYEPQRSVPASS